MVFMVSNKKEKSKKTTQHFPAKHIGVVKINEKHLVNDFVCEKCLKEIKSDERFVLLGTYDLTDKTGETLLVGFVSEHFYHLNCWVEYFNKKVTERLMQTQSQAMELMQNNPMVNKFLKTVGLMKA